MLELVAPPSLSNIGLEYVLYSSSAPNPDDNPAFCEYSLESTPPAPPPPPVPVCVPSAIFSETSRSFSRRRFFLSSSSASSSPAVLPARSRRYSRSRSRRRSARRRSRWRRACSSSPLLSFWEGGRPRSVTLSTESSSFSSLSAWLWRDAPWDSACSRSCPLAALLATGAEVTMAPPPPRSILALFANSLSSPSLLSLWSKTNRF
mmetsp:Transcript_18589/g.30077  ORF Transcript_18589/g.30077 Transcript_18589/m.30077 type:complete len:205 (-) Transcript_18589:91-705(-)